MTSNSQTIIQDIRQEFEMLLEFVMNDEAKAATADHIERSLFKMLLSVGAKLLVLFFVMRSENCSREVRENSAGQRLAYQHERRRLYFSIFGKVPIWRPYFYKQGVGGETPLDAELGLGDDILHKGIICDLSKVWKLRVNRESRVCLCLPEVSFKTSVMAALKVVKF